MYLLFYIDTGLWPMLHVYWTARVFKKLHGGRKTPNLAVLFLGVLTGYGRAAEKYP